MIGVYEMKVSHYLLNQDKYKVDTTYQRPADVWSYNDKQCFIDTLLRGEPIPIFFFNYVTNEDIYYIVDGQQRLNCIFDFNNNKIKLNKEFSESTLDGKTFKDLSSVDREKFLNYDLKTKIMKDYDDERVRMIFSRLQRGKPLYMGEKLNAKPGKIVEVMRSIANHHFITYSIGINKQRYKTYEDVARIIFYEKYGSKDCSTNPINEMFDKFKNDIYIDSKIHKKVLSVLNYLLKCFPIEPGNYQYLSKHAWIQTVYSVISDLRDTHAINGREAEIRNFVEMYHSRVYDEDWRTSDIKIQRFYDNARGGWAERLNENRKNTLKEFLILELKIKELDYSRQISEEEKITLYNRANGRCEKCSFKFKDYKEPEYHHVELYSNGGQSTLNNLLVLCTACHDDIHRNKPVDTHGFTDEDSDEIDE